MLWSMNSLNNDACSSHMKPIKHLSCILKWIQVRNPAFTPTITFLVHENCILSSKLSLRIPKLTYKCICHSIILLYVIWHKWNVTQVNSLLKFNLKHNLTSFRSNQGQDKENVPRSSWIKKTLITNSLISHLYSKTD